MNINKFNKIKVPPNLQKELRLLTTKDKNIISYSS